jgi:hypothetical protein
MLLKSTSHFNKALLPIQLDWSWTCIYHQILLTHPSWANKSISGLHFSNTFSGPLVDKNSHIPYILESNLHPVFATFLNGKKLGPFLQPTLAYRQTVWIILDVWYVYFVMQCNRGPFIAFWRYVSSVDNAVNIPRTKLRLLWHVLLCPGTSK